MLTVITRVLVLLITKFRTFKDTGRNWQGWSFMIIILVDERSTHCYFWQFHCVLFKTMKVWTWNCMLIVTYLGNYIIKSCRVLICMGHNFFNFSIEPINFWDPITLLQYRRVILRIITFVINFIAIIYFLKFKTVFKVNSTAHLIMHLWLNFI